MQRVFDQADAREDLSRRQHLRRSRRDQLAQSPHAELVHGARALQLAQADERHLHQATLVRPVVVGMRLDAVDQNDAVRLVGVPIHEDPERQFSSRQLHDIHRRPHGRAHGVLDDAVLLEDRGLTIAGRAAVAAHCGHDEWMGAAGAHIRGDPGDDRDEVVDAAAAGGDRDPCARSNQVVQALKLLVQGDRGSSRCVRSNRWRILMSCCPGMFGAQLSDRSGPLNQCPTLDAPEWPSSAQLCRTGTRGRSAQIC